MPAKRDLDPGATPLHFFGAEVRRAREADGMTLADLGALVPCDASTVSKIEAQLRTTERFVTARRDLPAAGVAGPVPRALHAGQDVRRRSPAGPHRNQPNAYAAIRNLVTGAFRRAGFANIAHARLYYGRDDQRILSL